MILHYGKTNRIAVFSYDTIFDVLNKALGKWNIDRENDVKKIKCVRVASVPYAFVHIEATIHYLIKNDYEVILVSSWDPYIDDYLKKFPKDSLQFHEIKIDREISPISDLISLFRLFIYLLKTKPDIVHSSTPKAAIVTAVAAFFARVPIRIHTFTGQRWATLTGKMRRFLIFLDWLIIKLNSANLADSPSQVEFLKEHGLAPVGCILKGSFGGVDLMRFSPERRKSNYFEIRQKLNIEPNARVAIFLGRLNRDKGIDNLIECFLKISEDSRPWYILLVGPYENITNPIQPQNEKILFSHPRIKFVGMQFDPVPYIAASDFMILPSFREGFGTSVIEASGLELPTIGRRIPGLIDSIIHNETGFLFDTPEQFVQQMELLFTSSSRCQILGQQARSRALKYFGCEVLAKEQHHFYCNMLASVNSFQIESSVEKS